MNIKMNIDANNKPPRWAKGGSVLIFPIVYMALATTDGSIIEETEIRV
jgi:hypothetical protein